jgi:hypothetical protein
MRDMKTRLLLFFKKLNHGDLSCVIQSKVKEANQPEVSVSCEVFKVQFNYDTQSASRRIKRERVMMLSL